MSCRSRPGLQLAARALECLLHQPVGSSLFWSRAGAKAAVHYDKRDNMIVQLEGRKRWFISTDPPGLQNNWQQVGEPLPNLQRHCVVDVEPGDLIYIPRGTPHTVELTTKSLHLAILFVPLTLREAIIAAVDHLSDSDRSFRETAVSRVQAADIAALTNILSARVLQLARTLPVETFVQNALELRSSRMIADLPALPKPEAPPRSITRETCVRHSPLAICDFRSSSARSLQPARRTRRSPPGCRAGASIDRFDGIIPRSRHTRRVVGRGEDGARRPADCERVSRGR